MTIRAYIRHPVDVPIEFSILDTEKAEKSATQNLSLGGLCFRSPEELQSGALINIRIDIVSPVFEANARVIWCFECKEHYEVGVQFINEKDAFTARMVEQICHIEHYRIWVKDVEGRDLDCERAAVEWIGKYAKDFPSLSD